MPPNKINGVREGEIVNKCCTNTLYLMDRNPFLFITACLIDIRRDHVQSQLVGVASRGRRYSSRREPLLRTPPSTQMVKLDTNLTCKWNLGLYPAHIVQWDSLYEMFIVEFKF